MHNLTCLVGLVVVRRLRAPGWVAPRSIGPARSEIEQGVDESTYWEG